MHDAPPALGVQAGRREPSSVRRGPLGAIDLLARAKRRLRPGAVCHMHSVLLCAPAKLPDSRESFGSTARLRAFSGYPRDVSDVAHHDIRCAASADRPVRIAPGRPCRVVQADDRGRSVHCSGVLYLR